MTSAQPYRGRHSAPDSDEVDAAAAVPSSAAEVAPAEPEIADHAEQPEPATPGIARPTARRNAPWAAFNGAVQAPTPGQQPVPAPEMPIAEPAQEWVAFTPPIPQQQPTWDMPTGFVPLAPPRRRIAGLKGIVIVAAVAVVASVGWFGYKVMSHHSSAPEAQAIVPVAAVDYTSTTGHFAVKLPAQPTVTTATVSRNGYTMDITVAVDSPDKQAVGGFAVTPGMPTGAASTALLNGFVQGMGNSGSTSNVSQSTFQGHPAITATVSKDSEQLSVMAFIESPNQAYVLVAENDASLRSLESTFRPTP